MLMFFANVFYPIFNNNNNNNNNNRYLSSAFPKLKALYNTCGGLSQTALYRCKLQARSLQSYYSNSRIHRCPQNRRE